MAHPVFDAVYEADSENLRKILDQNPASVHELDESGFTPLLAAVYSNFRSEECVKIILDAGADPNDTGKSGYPPLCCATGLATNASTDNFLGVARALTYAGADLEGRQRYGWTALVEALMAKSHVEVSVLLSLGAKPFVVVPKSSLPSFVAGLTSLEIAFMFEDQENLSALLCAGADPKCKTIGAAA